MAGSRRWTKDETRLAFRLYCEIPFGKLHQRNPSVIALAQRLSRTPGSVALKLVNLAHLDPALRARGIRGMSNVSQLDRDVVGEALADWDGLIEQTDEEWFASLPPDERLAELTTEVLATVNVRRGQAFFRKAVLAAYDYQCCICRLDSMSYLVSSHIKPWAADERCRIDPRNGLALCILHDRAFDRGHLTVLPSLKIRVSPWLGERLNHPIMEAAFAGLKGAAISPPSRFVPDSNFLRYHNRVVFLGT